MLWSVIGEAPKSLEQARQGFRFTVEASEAFSVGGHRFRQDLDRNLPGEVRVGGPIDLTHSASAEERRHLVRTDSGAWADGHSEGILRDWSSCAHNSVWPESG
jgi:hypothetical protein